MISSRRATAAAPSVTLRIALGVGGPTRSGEAGGKEGGSSSAGAAGARSRTAPKALAVTILKFAGTDTATLLCWLYKFGY